MHCFCYINFIFSFWEKGWSCIYALIYYFLPHLQLDMGQRNAVMASDSSDRTKDKSDQKVVLVY